jgi:hypothetical protein
VRDCKASGRKRDFLRGGEEEKEKGGILPDEPRWDYAGLERERGVDGKW